MLAALCPLEVAADREYLAHVRTSIDWPAWSTAPASHSQRRVSNLTKARTGYGARQ